MIIMVTGGAGFIGSNFLNLHVPQQQNKYFINLDKLTYAANLLNIAGIAQLPNYSFEKVDLSDYEKVNNIFNKNCPEMVIHFAAESHVDRSILGPTDFIWSNVIGTFNLLEACRGHWNDYDGKLFLHVSTDEVYGSLGKSGFFTEKTSYDPSSPYSASKASSDHLVRAYQRTYGLPAIITNCSNNYGPYQFPEKLIPLIILNAVEGKSLPVYGKGKNIRDWIYVEDHCRAIWTVLEKGKPGETYNIGGSNEWQNIAVVETICEILAEETGESAAAYKKKIKFVPDRPGHDLRYAVDTTKIKTELSWNPRESFISGLRKTIRWYLDNHEWVESVKSGAYRNWLEINYTNR